MEVSGTLDPSAAISSEDKEAAWAPEPVWAVWKEKRICHKLTPRKINNGAR